MKTAEAWARRMKKVTDRARAKICLSILLPPPPPLSLPLPLFLFPLSFPFPAPIPPYFSSSRFSLFFRVFAPSSPSLPPIEIVYIDATRTRGTEKPVGRFSRRRIQDSGSVVVRGRGRKRSIFSPRRSFAERNDFEKRSTSRRRDWKRKEKRNRSKWRNNDARSKERTSYPVCVCVCAIEREIASETDRRRRIGEESERPIGDARGRAPRLKQGPVATSDRRDDVHGKFARLRPSRVIIVARARNRGKRRETSRRRTGITKSVCLVDSADYPRIGIVPEEVIAAEVRILRIDSVCRRA